MSLNPRSLVALALLLGAVVLPKNFAGPSVQLAFDTKPSPNSTRVTKQPVQLTSCTQTGSKYCSVNAVVTLRFKAPISAYDLIDEAPLAPQSLRPPV